MTISDRIMCACVILVIMTLYLTNKDLHCTYAASDSPSLATLHTVHFFPVSRWRSTSHLHGERKTHERPQWCDHGASKSSSSSKLIWLTKLDHDGHDINPPKVPTSSNIRHPKLHIDHQLIGAHEASAMLSQASPALLERAICLTASSLVRQPATRKGDRNCFLFLAAYLDNTTRY